ncbi:hypothetical protein M5K25_009601 [Dendrobium thyrsiflorum]|uniref:Plant heme peroxidase family profile domain-containing protein n=1 Tax=Dendrobium thyrsiflorum TaxID=117978 RepID=A0ABD0V5U7_DENTH
MEGDRAGLWRQKGGWSEQRERSVVWSWRYVLISRSRMAKSYPIVSAEYEQALEKSKRKLRGLIAEKNCTPIMLRLAWHSAGTYDVATKTGGPFGTMRHKEELSHGANNGFDIAIRLLEPIKEQFPILSYADFYQLAGVIAVEVKFVQEAWPGQLVLKQSRFLHRWSCNCSCGVASGVQGTRRCEVVWCTRRSHRTRRALAGRGSAGRGIVTGTRCRVQGAGAELEAQGAGTGCRVRVDAQGAEARHKGCSEIDCICRSTTGAYLSRGGAKGSRRRKLKKRVEQFLRWC